MKTLEKALEGLNLLEREGVFESVGDDPIIVIDKTHIPNYIRHRFHLWIHNTSETTLYFKIVAGIPNWVLGTTSHIPEDGKLGAIGAGLSKDFIGVIVRDKPGGEAEDVGDFVVECYPDSGYTGLIESHSHPTTIYIEDLESWANVQKFDFDDGTSQGWTLTRYTIESDKSIAEGGYSARHHAPGYDSGEHSISKEITLPNTPKVRVSYYWWVKCVDSTINNFTHIRITVNGTIVYNCCRSGYYMFPVTVDAGWFKSAADISEYRGQTITLSIAINAQSNWSGYTYHWIDDVVVAGK